MKARAATLLVFALSFGASALAACPEAALAAPMAPGALFGATPSQGWSVSLGGDLYLSADRGGVVPFPAFRVDAVYGADPVDVVLRLSTVAVLNLAEVGGRFHLAETADRRLALAAELTVSGLLGFAKDDSNSVTVPSALAVVPTLLASLTRASADLAAGSRGPVWTLGMGLPIRIASRGFADLDGTLMLRPIIAAEFTSGFYLRGEAFIPLPLHTGNVIPSLALGVRL